MSTRLRRFLDEVRQDFWAHDYTERETNDLLVSASRALYKRPRGFTLELLRDLWDLDLALDLDSRDPDVTSVVRNHDTLKGVLDDLLGLLVRQILRDQDRPEGWQHLPLDERDGPLAKEDKRRIRLARQAEEQRLAPLRQAVEDGAAELRRLGLEE